MTGDTPTKNKTIGARWIATGDGRLLKHGALRVSGGIIAELIDGGQAAADQDLGDVLMTPAWVNAHTHLEFSNLSEPLGSPGMPITAWIPLVIADRIQNSAASNASIAQGLSEICETGTIAVGEIATQPWHRNPALQQQIQTNQLLLTTFVERLGNQPDENSAKVYEAQDWLNFDAELAQWQGGLSPHAPYSTNFDLFTQLVRHAKSAKLPLAMHLAESQEELQFLTKGSGLFWELLERLNAAPIKKQSRTILDFIQAMSELRQGLIIHGNYLNSVDMDFISKHKSLHVVYCPRTHSFFQHAAYPLDALRDRGINIAIGTDSRASNPDLNLLSELRELAAQFSGVPADEVLQFGTINGAKALGIDSVVGSLSKGKRADFLSFPVLDDANPLEALFRGT